MVDTSKISDYMVVFDFKKSDNMVIVVLFLPENCVDYHL